MTTIRAGDDDDDSDDNPVKLRNVGDEADDDTDTTFEGVFDVTKINAVKLIEDMTDDMQIYLCENIENSKKKFMNLRYELEKMGIMWLTIYSDNK